MAHLLLRFEGGRVQRIELTKSPTVLGRGRECDVQVVDPKVSRRHCQLVLVHESWYLADLASQNHTWIGGRSVTEHPLNDGDRFRIGSTHVIFRTEEDPAEVFHTTPDWS